MEGEYAEQHTDQSRVDHWVSTLNASEGWILIFASERIQRPGFFLSVGESYRTR